jgi:hypothetical protein
VLGVTLATVGLSGLCYGLIEGPSLGFGHRLVVAALLAGITAILPFVLVEARVRHPLLPLMLFGNHQFAAANLVTLVVDAALGGTLFLLPIEVQQVAGYSALQSGIALLPITFIMLILSSRSGGLASRIGPRLQMTVGPLPVAAGMALFVRLEASSSYLTEVLPALLVLGLGLAGTVAPLTSIVLAAAPSHQAGVASAVNNDVARTASLLAVAILPAAAGLTGVSYLHPIQFRRASGPRSYSQPHSAPSAVFWPRSPSATRPPEGGPNRSL